MPFGGVSSVGGADGRVVVVVGLGLGLGLAKATLVAAALGLAAAPVAVTAATPVAKHAVDKTAALSTALRHRIVRVVTGSDILGVFLLRARLYNKVYSLRSVGAAPPTLSCYPAPLPG
ncbi:MAG TPA: hypothetical protein VME46_25955 [Acidimicrobiales bacterium]|nr:hypothetical protein [Acidimicrobiales bacterium]